MNPLVVERREAQKAMTEHLKKKLNDIEGIAIDEDEDGCIRVRLCEEKPARRRTIESVSNILAETMLEDMQKPVIARLVKKRHEGLTVVEQSRLLFEARRILSAFWVTKREKWLRETKQRVAAHLEENGEIQPESFLRFRMKDMLTEWEAAVERAHEELLIEKEYNEFISLLRYFVELQKPKAREVHILCDGAGGYTIFDENMEIMNCREFLIGTEAINSEDALISSLINIAPYFITIHAQKEKMPKVMDTINMVFSGRVKYEPEAGI